MKNEKKIRVLNAGTSLRSFRFKYAVGKEAETALRKLDANWYPDMPWMPICLPGEDELGMRIEDATKRARVYEALNILLGDSACIVWDIRYDSTELCHVAEISVMSCDLRWTRLTPARLREGARETNRAILELGRAYVAKHAIKAMEGLREEPKPAPKVKAAKRKKKGAGK